VSDARAILDRVSEAYASCESYHDEGVVVTTFYNPTRRTQRPFSTRFVRSRGFLFEFRKERGEEGGSQYAVWMEKGRARSWWSIRPERDDADTLGVALAGASGVSGGSAYRVPYLLMPELHDGRPPRLRPPVIVDVAGAAAQGCIVVERAWETGGVEQIWIDSTTHLIRRVVEPRHVLGPQPRGVLDDLKAEYIKAGKPGIARGLDHLEAIQERIDKPVEVEAVTEYKAEFNAEVAEADLLFGPPAMEP
jgi:hypothetical protein